VLPALMLNYLGQGAMILAATPERAAGLVHNPFFLMAPEQVRFPLVILATVATVIASQAVISGAFSVTQQAIQLGFIPRLRIIHTSSSAAGQIYIPSINWALMVMVMVLVMMFRSSSNLAAAYGIAVTGAMMIDTCLIGVVLFSLWKWNPGSAAPSSRRSLLVDFAYFAANLTKVPDGGWFPLLMGFIIFTLLTTWARGGADDQADARGAMPVEVFVRSAAIPHARARHRGVHDVQRARRAARAAPQPQAQQGAARARDPADGEDRGRALCRSVQAAVPRGSGAGLLPARRPLRLHGRSRRAGGAGAHHGMRPELQDDGDELLPRAADADRLERGPAWRSGARSCSPGCCATRKARWNSSACPPIAWSSWAARSRSERLAGAWRWPSTVRGWSRSARAWPRRCTAC
jgi:hypothetical protein